MLATSLFVLMIGQAALPSGAPSRMPICAAPPQYAAIEALHTKATTALTHGVMELGKHAYAKHARGALDDARTTTESTNEAGEALAALPAPADEREKAYRTALGNVLQAEHVHAARLTTTVRAEEDENRANSNVSSANSSSGSLLVGIASVIASNNARKQQAAAHVEALKARHALEDDIETLNVATRAYDRAREAYAGPCAPAPSPSP
jgi:hypothetical protein